MSTYEIDHLFHRWERGELSAEQAWVICCKM